MRAQRGRDGKVKSQGQGREGKGTLGAKQKGKKRGGRSSNMAAVHLHMYGVSKKHTGIK